MLIFFSILMVSATYSLAQKRVRNDYILFQDSLHIDGRILEIPTLENQSLVFRSIKGGQEKTYGVNDVSEFQYKDRKFFRKDIGSPREMLVFLELIPTENQDLALYRLNVKKETFYLENKSTGKLYAVNGQVSDAFSSLNKNDAVNPLIGLTKQTAGSIAYLLNSADQVKDLRTFSKPIYVEPFFGTGIAIAEFGIEPVEQVTEMAGLAISGGLSIEAFLNFKRNISISFSPQLFGFDATKFEKIQLPNGQNYETDLSISMIALQFPVAVKYYIDLKPQKFRTYLEMGYAFSNTLNQKSYQFGAWKKNNEITFHSDKPVLADSYQGIHFGAGANIIRKNNRILTLGLKSYLQSGNLGNTTLSIHLITLGLKF
ncbi:hypothetical protein [Aquiflexum gelatinilyticum]|uniref:Outer membrane protein beta-barrel domain-containing protein n=1 Tax=Aquiflexum gelatinilyticum TaxID=2961943 RepID=A0A9X2P9B2_9BACT|nr:hypothetical protein [Aquiflexum gelatinilyticum]MCR9016185.1 hypothetical protein [Aquiflexum gelatinilyticum]